MSSAKIPLAAFLAAAFGLLACVAAWFFAAEQDAPGRRSSHRDDAPRLAAAHLEFVPTAIGAPVAEFERPWVTHLEIVDLDRDGRLDVIYCDVISLRFPHPKGFRTETYCKGNTLPPRLASPYDPSVAIRLQIPTPARPTLENRYDAYYVASYDRN